MHSACLDTLKNYLIIIEAQGFRYTENSDKVDSSPLENVANACLVPLQAPIDYVLKNFDRPLFIVAFNIAAVAGTTIYIYPNESFQVIEAACSPFFHFESWMPKFASYIFTQTMTTSLMIRTYSRCGQGLLAALKEKKIEPIHLGTRNLQTNQH